MSRPTLVYNVGQFTDSDRFCPRGECGKRLVVDSSAGGVHLCLACDYREESSALVQQVSIREAVATATALRGATFTTTPCPGCFVLVIETVTSLHRKPLVVDAEPVAPGEGSLLLFPQPDGPPLASSMPLIRRRSPGLRKAHVCEVAE